MAATKGGPYDSYSAALNAVVAATADLSKLLIIEQEGTSGVWYALYDA